jgi:hypothetical protein
MRWNLIITRNVILLYNLLSFSHLVQRLQF